jgi:hypothetical protein
LRNIEVSRMRMPHVGWLISLALSVAGASCHSLNKESAARAVDVEGRGSYTPRQALGGSEKQRKWDEAIENTDGHSVPDGVKTESGWVTLKHVGGVLLHPKANVPVVVLVQYYGLKDGSQYGLELGVWRPEGESDGRWTFKRVEWGSVRKLLFWAPTPPYPNVPG